VEKSQAKPYHAALGFDVAENPEMSLKMVRSGLWAPLVAALALSTLASVASAQAAAGDAVRGAKLAYTCYGCHEHTPAKIRAEHEEEGIRDFSDCVQCHRSAQEEPRERGREGGREGGRREKD